MAISKDDFIQAAVTEIAKYPKIAQRFQIGDPLISQAMGSIAAMLSDLSNQVELTAGEVFIKARDVTILADAAVKGVLPFATPSIASITLLNEGSESIRVLAGRVLLDQAGRYWLVSKGATVLAGASGTIIAKQVSLRTVVHSVSQYVPFYTVELTAPEVGYIAEVAVDGYTYTPEFCNVNAGEPVYHVKCDENQTMSIMFGVDNVAGKQPAAGSTIGLSIYDTEGEISLSVGTTFTFEYTNAGDDAVTMTLAEISQTGAGPMDLVTMAEVCSYPGIYNKSAVYLSNFDYLVRQQVASLTFLSVWNETREEAIRGPSQNNMNTIFVSALRDGTSDSILQEEISAVILTADNSYKIAHRPVIEVHEPLALTLSIPSTYDAAAVKEAVRALVLKNYGRESAWAKRGEAKILKKDLYKLCRDNVPALNQRIADITIDAIGDGSAMLPEQFRYVTDASLVINVEEAE